MSMKCVLKVRAVASMASVTVPYNKRIPGRIEKVREITVQREAGGKMNMHTPTLCWKGSEKDSVSIS